MPEREANRARYFFESVQLPSDTFEVLDFVGEERISRPFQFEVTLVSEDPEIDFGDVINAPATLTMMRQDETYPIHGVVSDLQQRGRTADWYVYKATLVPRLWLLSLNYRSRIFQDVSVEDIVRNVLKEAGFSSQDFRFSLNSSYDPREYCVQYEETDLNFISRLLEHEGIHFFFEHGTNQEEVVFADHGGENPEIGGSGTLQYHSGAGMVPDEPETVNEFVYRERVGTGKVKLKDYNYEGPKTLQSESQINSDMPGTQYEYGPHMRTQSEGDRLATVRNEEIEAQRQIVEGAANCLRFRAGQRFELAKHFRGDLNTEYLITTVRHVGSQRSGLGVGNEEGDGEPGYRNEFSCLRASVTYRPPRVTPVPEVPGVMTARVDGTGDYAYLDDKGRYRAKMHFDRRDKSDGTATHPIRMKQPYSGSGEAGFHASNHPGTEMVFSCVNGDPDRPMALGTTPNPNNPSPVTNENNSQHVLRTTSENEFVVEDQDGKERMTMFSPYKNSMVSIGAGAAKNEGVTASTDSSVGVGAKKGVSIHGGSGIMLSAWSGEMGGETTTSILNNAKGALKALTAYAFTKLSGGFDSAVNWQNPFEAITAADDVWGNLKQAMVEFGKSAKEAGSDTPVTDALTELDRPGIFATCEGGVDVISKEDITLIPAGGFAVNTVLGASVNALAGIDLITGKDLLAFSKEGIVEIVADQDIVKLDAASKSVLMHGKEMVGMEGEQQVVAESDEQIILKCGDSKIVLNSDGTIEITGKEIEIEGKEVEVEGSSEVELESRKIEIDGGSTGNVTIKGSNITSEAQMMNEVKGSTVSSKATMTNIIKGSMTKIG